MGHLVYNGRIGGAADLLGIKERVFLKVYVYPYVSAFPTGGLDGCVPVAVDVLRATSTIARALASGATAIIPALEPEEARALAARYPPGSCVLGGERGGLRIAGFDLGNSPAEYTPAAVAGKRVLFTTSNGTRAIRRAGGLGPVYILSFLNVGTVAAALLAAGRDVAVACAGSGDEFSLEDTACAGALAEALAAAGAPLELNDLAWAARELYRAHRGGLLALLHTARHGQNLVRLGLGGDLAACARVDALPLLPVYRDGQISL